VQVRESGSRVAQAGERRAGWLGRPSGVERYAGAPTAVTSIGQAAVPRARRTWQRRDLDTWVRVELRWPTPRLHWPEPLYESGVRRRSPRRVMGGQPVELASSIPVTHHRRR
jgi:hypothetical protein